MFPGQMQQVFKKHLNPSFLKTKKFPKMATKSEKSETPLIEEVP